MKPEPLTPSQAAKLGIRLLKQKSDPIKSRAAQRYFKEEIKSLGISAPTMRGLAGEIHEQIKKAWSVEDAVEFCEILLPDPYHEVKALSILVLERFRKDFPKSLFLRIKGWLAKDYCDSWALVDVLCPNSVGALLQKYPELVEKIKTWTTSPNRWVRRASIVSFIKLAKKPGYQDAIYQIAACHFGDKDDLIQKANGWLLREAGKAHEERLERFLLERGPAIPRTTLRYAIERFDEKRRKRLLEVTRIRPV
jgi:3-methyladenine DNA glycosylase AlkD